MKNIEIKLAIDDFGAVIGLLKRLGATQEEELNQTDIYFHVPDGRLKLRAINEELYQLIYYSRPDTKESKLSDYKIVELTQSQHEAMRSMLQAIHGEMVIVNKNRILWLYKNTRVHLDTVSSLGTFVELETVINDITHAEGEEEHQMIIESLSLGDYEKISHSYCDLLNEKIR